MKKLYIYGIIILWLRMINAIPKPEERVHSEADRKAHINHMASEHNIQYDHDSFLGGESKTFDQLPPEESRRRLLVIVGNIDTDKNGLVDLSELKTWIQFTQKRYITDDVARQWKQHNSDGNETLQWEVYRANVYGFMEEMDPRDLENEDNGFSYKSMLARDRRRWSVADRNIDDELSLQEFTAFLHPEESLTMRDIVLTETIEDIDNNKDGKISIDEYIGDMYKGLDSDDEEPDWVLNEREVFTKFRDANHDGFLDREEVREWITPNDFDHAEAEAKHLIHEADEDGNDKLSKDEILAKYDLFVGSQATDFGEALTRHDEF